MDEKEQVHIMTDASSGLNETPDSDGMESTTRRTFVKTGFGLVGACYAGAIGYPIYRYLATPAVRAAEMGAITELAFPETDMPQAGSALRFMFGPRPALLIHHADGSVVCFDAVCTHLGCTVEFQPDQNRIHCACHGGTYDMHSGKNVAGPPPKPLRQFNVEVADGQIIVSRA
jgi:cytochrome b6-f complex iron-sulfur subunit